MGEQNVNALDEQQRKAFTKALLNEVVALETMLNEDRFETGIRRIGAEQEMFFVDENLNAAPVVMQVLEKINDDRLTTELAQFNIEANLEPHVFGGDCLRRMEGELQGLIDSVREASSAFGAQVLLVGILPMLRRSDLDLEMMTPKQRYYELNRVMCRLRGGEFHVLIKGVDQLELTHDSVMLEACNTSFQIHFQVAPNEFARFYNLAQAVSAPVLATAVNSPVLLGQRLWSETRIALFERSVDVRSTHQAGRGFRPRVHFGDKWVKESVLELFREDISRHKIVLSIDLDEDARAVVEAGGNPKLMALRLHNGTVYRWNRPCYGISNGVPHLRIENRVLPAGPTVIDEVANSAFFFGLMASLIEEYPNISEVMAFDDAKRNFFAAARDGLDAQFTWLNGRNHTASALILDHLLPLARHGLTASGIDSDDVSRYLDVIEERTRSQQTGSQWALRSLNGMSADAKPNLRFRKLTSSMLDNQRAGLPVHEWNLAVLDQDKRDRNWRSSYQTVGQIMTTDLFTVQPNDIVDLAASVMEWSHVRHVPVEDEDGHLVGLISSRTLLRMVARGKTDEMTEVGSIMAKNLVTVGSEMPTTEAIHMMREEQVSCLPVVDESGKLIGMVTERDLIVVSSRLLQDFLTES
ncbi:MAG: CBS domain-containing protein [Myxococcota bacterium]|nr:CBS domain-containing protein [Myxococcota bacterium]